MARRDEAIANRWKIRRKSGKDIILRDVLEKIGFWIRKFREIGDIAVQYDPTHAALPWAGIRFLLQVRSFIKYFMLSVNVITFRYLKVTVSESETFCAMTEGLEKISSLIVHYGLMEGIFLQHATKPTDELRAALLRLYGSILEFLGKSAHFFGQNIIKRIVKATFDTSIMDVLLQNISDRQDDVDRSAFLVQGDQLTALAADVLASRVEVMAIRGKLDNLSLSTTNLHDETKDELRRLWDTIWNQSLPLHRIAVQVSELADQLHQDRSRKLLNWLSVVPNDQHHQSIRQGRLSGTGTWLLEKPEFQNWMQASYSSVLWLHGIPGSGKSMLT